jgi:hypothetical protein
MQSANGTVINNQRIQRHVLTHNDVVQCGSIIIRYVEDGPLIPPHVRRGRRWPASDPPPKGANRTMALDSGQCPGAPWRGPRGGAGRLRWSGAARGAFPAALRAWRGAPGYGRRPGGYAWRAPGVAPRAATRARAPGMGGARLRRWSARLSGRRTGDAGFGRQRRDARWIWCVSGKPGMAQRGRAIRRPRVGPLPGRRAASADAPPARPAGDGRARDGPAERRGCPAVRPGCRVVGTVPGCRALAARRGCPVVPARDAGRCARLRRERTGDARHEWRAGDAGVVARPGCRARAATA